MKSNVLFLLTGMLLSSAALSAEETIGLDAQKQLNITIYNNDRALVKDIRRVPVKPGKNEIAFSGISGQIIPASVVLDGTGITFLENNFNFDLLSYASLLQKSVGETVTVQYMNPKTGIMETNTAEILALNMSGGSPAVLKINGKIDASYPGRILFSHIPENLRAKPTLVMSVMAEAAAPQDLTLNYLTTGLSWDANYVAQLSADSKSMILNGWVSLTNHSGVDYQNAQLQVVAGDVHTVAVAQPIRERAYKSGAVFGDTLSAAPNSIMVEENIADYHLYTLPRATDVLDNQTKQVSLLEANDVGVQKIYTFDNQLRPGTEIKNIKPQVKLRFKNTKENKLGIALPRGVVRLYQADKKGDLIFVGEDRIGHVGNLEEVNLNMGKAFDISADAKLVSHSEGWKAVRRNSGMGTDEIGYDENTYAITVKNGTSEPVIVSVIENFGNNWTITTENKPSSQPTAQQAKWELSVPAEETALLTYTVQTENGRRRTR